MSKAEKIFIQETPERTIVQVKLTSHDHALYLASSRKDGLGKLNEKTMITMVERLATMLDIEIEDMREGEPA